MLQSHELDRARERALGKGARRVAELEDRCDRQRRTLQELAVASEALAKDNVALSNELVALRDSNEENETKVRELTARLSSAQRLYLAGQKSLERAEELREATAGGADELDGHHVRSAAESPAVASGSAQKAERRVVALSAPRAGKRTARSPSRAAQTAAGRGGTTATHRRVAQAAVAGERQVARGGVRRKSAYAKSLERRLLSQHKTLRGVARRRERRPSRARRRPGPPRGDRR